MTRIGSACLLLLLVPALGRTEQGTPPDLAPGARVRVLAPTVSSKPLTGTIRSLSEDAVTLSVEGHDERVTLARGSILRVEVGQGRNRRKGLLVGGVAAAAVGAVVGGIGCRDSSDFDSWQCATILGGLGFAAGAGVGAIVGAGERWQALPADSFRVTLHPTAGGRPGLSIHVSF
jgi:hypothetical protein